MAEDLPVPEHASAEIPRNEVDEATLARVLRCEVQTVRKYARLGIIKRTKPGRYALFQSIGGVVEHYRQLASGHGTADAMRAGAALKDAQRKLVELRYDRENGALISMPEIEAAWADLAHTIKTMFLSLPRRLWALRPQLKPEDIEVMERLCVTMLTEAAFNGRPYVPAQAKDAKNDNGTREA
jgi:phage terminase Nu1 subunit (DNA packaging protein)